MFSFEFKGMIFTDIMMNFVKFCQDYNTEPYACVCSDCGKNLCMMIPTEMKTKKGNKTMIGLRSPHCPNCKNIMFVEKGQPEFFRGIEMNITSPHMGQALKDDIDNIYPKEGGNFLKLQVH